MKTTKQILQLKIIAQIIFIALPTIAIVCFLFWNVSSYYSILHNQYYNQTIFFGMGLLTSMLFYAYRFRFITTTPLLFFALYMLYQTINNYGANWGEFDAFFYTTQFIIFSILFGVGWLVGYAFQRIKFFHFILSALLLTASIAVIAKTGGFDYKQFALLFTPILLYNIYIIFTIENINNAVYVNLIFLKKFLIRLLGFVTIIVLFLSVILLTMRSQIQASIMEAQGKGKGNKNATSQIDKDGKTQMNDAMNLSSSNSKNHELLFCAHIENYFEGTNEPNPLYLTSYHYTKFDTLTESFERDSLMPSNDEFTPDVSKLPLFAVATDSSKIWAAKSNKARESIEVELYNIKLSKNSFVAPSTAYQVQPITVDKNFQKEFISAYRSKSFVSKLNSAYFIYNVQDKNLEAFQSLRFDALRKAKSYTTIDSTFLKYYTFFPNSNAKFLPIKKLGENLAAGKNTTIDKVLAVKNYFLRRNELGQQTFTYSDNPGIPGIPNASKICYFLFESKKGYCAYYSAATLFLLRSMGIPCRIACGFLTENRANKNPGWYWFYGNQSHAWVEVYFPEYGWIDFDTTVGNEDSRSATQPDGTPPNPPAKAPLAINGLVINVDTINKIIALQVNTMTFKDKVYPANNTLQNFDVANAIIIQDTNVLKLKNINKGDLITGVSYDKKIFSIYASSAQSVLQQIKSPIGIDEIFITKNTIAIKQNNKLNEVNKQWSLSKILITVVGSLLMLCLAFLCIPILVSTYMFSKTKSNIAHKKINAIHHYVLFYLHQMGYKKQIQTPTQFAMETNKQFDINYPAFIAIYLKLKYSNAVISDKDLQYATTFLSNFKAEINKKIPSSIRIKKMLQPFITIKYFLQK
jgi:protein-glutamine gamma-glutamyltransferase